MVDLNGALQNIVFGGKEMWDRSSLKLRSVEFPLKKLEENFVFLQMLQISRLIR